MAGSAGAAHRARQLEEILKDAASDEVELVITDEFAAYNGIGKLFKHKRINHSKNYVRGILHTPSMNL